MDGMRKRDSKERDNPQAARTKRMPWRHVPQATMHASTQAHRIHQPQQDHGNVRGALLQAASKTYRDMHPTHTTITHLLLRFHAERLSNEHIHEAMTTDHVSIRQKQTLLVHSI